MSGSRVYLNTQQVQRLFFALSSSSRLDEPARHDDSAGQTRRQQQQQQRWRRRRRRRIVVRANCRARGGSARSSRTVRLAGPEWAAGRQNGQVPFEAAEFRRFARRYVRYFSPRRLLSRYSIYTYISGRVGGRDEPLPPSYCAIMGIMRRGVEYRLGGYAFRGAKEGTIF